MRSVARGSRGHTVGNANNNDKRIDEKGFLLGTALRGELKQIVAEAISEALAKMPEKIINTELLTVEQLAGRLQVPVSWVYEQSRHDKIPTRRVGRYIRFELREVLHYLAEAGTFDRGVRKAG